MPEQYSIKEFADKIRQRRPDLKDIPDGTLVGKTLEAAPQLKQFLNTTPAKPQPSQAPEERTAVEVAEDQAAKVLEGIPKAITGIPVAAIDTAKAIGAGLIGDVGPAFEMIKGAAEPVTTSLQGLGALLFPNTISAPTSQQFERAAEGAGANLGGTVLGELGGEVTGKVAKRLPRAAENIYQSGLKPKPRMYSNADIHEMVRTGLKNNLPISPSGLTRLNKLVDDLNTSIEADIATKPNAPISPRAVTTRLAKPLGRAGQQVNPLSDQGAILKSGQEFMQTNPTSIPAATAQEMKKGTYRAIGEKAYGEEGTASVAAQKALAMGLKEELENIFPEIKGKNFAEGQLLDLRPELEAAVNKLGNKPTLSRVLHVLTDPAIISRIAIALQQSSVPISEISKRLSTAGAIAGTEGTESKTGLPTSRQEALQLFVSH